MNPGLLNTIYLAFAFLLLFGFGEFLYHYLKVEASVTRKIVHVCTGLLTLLFPPLLVNHWYVLALCGSFLLILLLSLKWKLLPSINAVNRVTRGSLLYPVIVYGCFLLYLNYNSFIFYYIPILILAFCDPMAELIGKNFPWIRYNTFGHTKTISGSLGFFVSALILSSVLLIQVEGLKIFTAILTGAAVAITTTLAEGVSHKGYDNLTIPLSAGTVLLITQLMGYLS